MDSDFRIKVTSRLDKSGFEDDFKALKQACEAQKITLHIDSKQLTENLASIEKAFKNAFKFDNSQLSNLNSLKTVLTELNALSKDLKANIFGDGKAGTTSQAVKQLAEQSSKVKKLANEYDKLKAVQTKLKGQLSGLWETDSYNEVLAILKKINTETANAKKRLNRAGGKDLGLNIDATWADKLTEKFASVYQSIQKGALNTHQALEKYLSTNNLSAEESKTINSMLNQLKKIETKTFTNKTTYNNLRDWLVTIEEIKARAKDLKIDISYNDTADKDMQKLINDYQKLKTESKNLQTSMSKMKFGSEQYKEYESQLQEVQNKMKSTFKQIADASKTSGVDLKIDESLRRQFANVFNSIDNNIQKTKTKLQNMLNGNINEGQRNSIEKLLEDINKLDNIKLNDLFNLEKPYEELAKMDEKISEIQAKTSNIKLNTGGSNESKSVISSLISEYKTLATQIDSTKRNMSKTAVDTVAYKDLENILNELQAKFVQTGNKIKGFGVDLKGISAGNANNLSQTYIRQLNTISSSAKKTEQDLTKLLSGNITQNQTEAINNLVAKARELQSISINNLNTGNAQEEIAILNSEMSKLKTNSKNIIIDVKMNNIEAMRANIDSSISSLQKLNKSTKGLNSENINKLIAEYQRLKEVASGSLNESGLKQLQSDLSSANAKMKEIVATSTRMKDISMANISMNNLISELNKLHSQFEKLGRDTSEINKIKEALQGLDRTDLSKMSAGIQTAREKMSQIKSSVGEASSTSQGIRKSFSDLYSTVQGYSIGFMVGNALTQGLMEAKQTLLDLDEAFVEFKKVAPDSVDTSSEALDKLQQRAIGVGKSVASSSVDIIKGTASALQAGMKNVNSALQYAKNVNMYKNVADISLKDSDKYLKTTMSVWGGVNNSLKPIHESLKNATTDYSTMTKYMDLANYSGNKFAVTSGDIGEAYSRCASILKNNKVSMEDSIGLIIGAQEPTQNASKVGVALKTISTNLSGVMYSAKDGTVTLSKVGKALKDIAGINVIDKQTGQVKDQMETLSELHDKWDKLSEAQKQALSKTIAGTNHNNIFQALMSNWNHVIQLEKDYKNGLTVGSAEQENARYVDSLTGRLTQFKESLKGLLTNTVTNTFAKNVLQGSTTVVNAVDKMLSALGKIGGATPVALGSLLSMFNLMKNMANEDYTPIRTFGELFNRNGFLQNIKSGAESARLSMGYLGTGIKQIASKETTEGVENLKQGFKGMGVALGGIKTFGLMALDTALNAVGTALVTWGISKAFEALKENANKADNEIKNLTSSIDKHSKTIQSLQSNRNSIKDYAKTYEELSNKQKLSTEESNKLQQATEGIAKAMPDLVVGYDKNGSPILKMADDVDTLMNKYDALIKKEQDAMKIDQNSLADKSLKWLKQQEQNNRDSSVVGNTASNTVVGKMKQVQSDMNDVGASITSNFEANQARLRAGYDSWNQSIEDGYNSVVKTERTESKKLKAVQTGVINEFEENADFNKLSKKTQQLAESITGNMNFRDLNSGDISSFVSNVTNSLKNGDSAGTKALKTYEKLRAEFDKTGDVEAYRTGIESLIPSLSKATGLTQQQVRAMTQLDESYQTASSACEQFLMGQGYTTEMTSWNKQAQQLQYQFNQMNSTFNGLTNLKLNKDGKIQANLVWDILNAQDLPKNLESLIKKICGGNANGEITPKQLQVAQQLLFAFMTNDQEALSKLQGELEKKFGKGTMKKLFPNGLNLGSITGNYDITISDKEFKSVKDSLDKNLGDKKGTAEYKVKVKLEDDLAKGDVDAFIEDLNKVPKEKRAKVVSDVHDALNKLGTVNAYKLDKKIQKILGDNKDARTKYTQMKNKSNISKKFTITGYDKNAEAHYNYLKGLPVITKVVQFVARGVEAVKQASASLSKGGHTPESVGEAFNVSDTPTELNSEEMVQTMSADDSTASNAEPVATPTAINTSPVTAIGKMKALSTSVSDMIGIGSTQASDIKIKINYDVVNSSIKESVELLGNINNELDLMSSKLNLVKTEADNTFGKYKIKNLQKEIELLQSQSTLYEKQYKYLKKEQDVLKSNLKNNGVKFNDNGTISNYSKKMLAIQKKIDKLSESDSSSSSKSSKSSEKKQKAREKEQKQLEQLKSKMEKYNEISTKTLYDAKNNWYQVQESIRDCEEEIVKLQLEQSTYKFNNSIEQSTALLGRLDDEISVINTKLKNATGKNSIELMQQETEKLSEQQQQYNSELDNYNSIVDEYKKKLAEYGFEFNENNDISNLSDIYDKHYSHKDLDFIKELVKSYDDYNSKLRETEGKIATLESDSIDLGKKLTEALNTQALYDFNSAIQKQEKLVENLGNKLDLISAELKYAYGADKVKYMNQQIDLMKQEISSTQELCNNYKQIDDYYTNILSGYGFNLDENGSISNLDEILNKYKDSSELTNINTALEEFYKIHNTELPKAEKNLLTYQNNIQDTYNDELTLIKNVESKITDMYKDELNKRKTALQDTATKQTKIIDKLKNDYDKEKSQDDYEKNLRKQEETIEKLQEKINLAEKDNSLSGQSKLQSYLDQMETEKENLQNIIDNRQDSLIGDLFSSQTSKIQEDCDEAVKTLEDTWTDSKIDEMVKQALGSGVFTDIDGNISKLQESMIDFIQTTSDGMGILGDKTKTELIGNLETAMEYIKNYDDIYEGLKLEKYGNSYTDNNTSDGSAKTVNIDGVVINVDGGDNNPEEIAQEVKKQLDDYMSNITNRT